MLLSCWTTYSMGMTASAPAGTTPPVEIAIASPASSAPLRRPAGRDPLDDRQRAGKVRRAHRKAVHRRARERRQVDERAHGLRGDAPGRVRDGHGLGAERPARGRARAPAPAPVVSKALTFSA